MAARSIRIAGNLKFISATEIVFDETVGVERGRGGFSEKFPKTILNKNCTLRGYVNSSEDNLVFIHYIFTTY